MAATILLVDDDWFLADVLAESLRRQGWLVRVASTAADAVIVARAEPPDLVVLDPRLPDCDGWQVLGELRRARGEQPVPVVLVSSGPITRQELRRYQVTVFLPKPFRTPDLLASISSLLAAATA